MLSSPYPTSGPGPAAARPLLSTMQQDASFGELCALLGIQHQIADLSDEHRLPRLRVRNCQRIHLAGQTCDRIFVVNSGILKTSSYVYDKEQVMGFPMRGDLLGIDGLLNRSYHQELVALTNATLIEIPLDTLARLGRTHGEFASAILGVMSHKLARDHALLSMRAGLNTQARMAHFLLDTAARYAAAGYSGSSFNLVMQRAEIGNYLGMAMETVSRTLSELQALEMISINGRTILILDPVALRAMRRSPRRRRLQDGAKRA
ncbi:Crp/Fnr family transcriptional regulator [Pseudoduganella aquatica]|uniref:Helix-turn-helix domain-containing protein n=1 Tax=Pseudoduganella aquatica TaxID=2660641 RepID=A0A7X4HIH5_9BURK|nr:helix-turn-helix domain-containing protein [Pseudoduganella aquatica]MYN10775.1 helix-turn-helix domain-containing protein [Pseudoduganella aquatica]